MSKNIISQFRAGAVEFAARHDKTMKVFIGIVYGAGDAFIAAIPVIKSGFVDTVRQGNPHWNLLASAYANDPVPAVATVILGASDVLIAKDKLALGHLGYAFAGVLLGINFAMRNAPQSARAMIPMIVGGIIGTGYKYLEEKFGESSNPILRHTLGAPKRMAGVCFLFNSGSSVLTGHREHIKMLIGAGSSWGAGNVTSMVLLPDKKVEAVASLRPANDQLSHRHQEASLDAK